MKIKYIAISVIAILYATDASAWRYNHGRFGMRITGHGTAGIIEPDFEKPDFLGDWRLRGQLNYAPASGQTIGAVYAIDAQTVDDDEYIDDAFLLYENRRYGRMELGLTESIAGKLGLGLPDVGGMRINDTPLFYKKISPNGPVIGDTTLDSGDQSIRLNLATLPTGPVQYGISFAGITDDFNYAIDAGLKIRQSAGKLKTAFALGASFMDSPDNFNADQYAPNVTADWRAQISAGLNLQYNSWIFAITGRAIYDQNPIGRTGDGIAAGTGVSYDLLKYSVSLSYLYTDTGIWHSDIQNYTDHTVIGSLRYKYSENIDGWISIGISTDTPFISTAMRISF